MADRTGTFVRANPVHPDLARSLAVRGDMLTGRLDAPQAACAIIVHALADARGYKSE